jgi:Arc/MetJ family transcription regulator
MRINVDIDEKLFKKAMKLSNGRSRREVIEKGLKRLVEHGNQARILKLKGKVEFWPGYDYKETRRDRVFNGPGDSR